MMEKVQSIRNWFLVSCVMTLVLSCNPLGDSNTVSGDLCVPTFNDPECTGSGSGGGSGGNGGNGNATNPTLTIEQAAGQADPTNDGTIEFTATFSEAIDPNTFDATDITQIGTATVTWAVSDNGDATVFTITATALTDGTVIPFVVAGAASTEAGGTSGASSGTDNTVTLDTVITPPSNFSHDTTLLTMDNTPSSTWTVSPDVDILRYEIAVGTTGMGAGQNDLVDWMDVGNGNSHVGFMAVAGLVNCTDYFSSIRAVDNAGNLSTTVTTAAAFQVDSMDPTMPGAFTISNTFAKTDRTHTVTWTASTDNCGLDQYEFAVGLTSGASDVMPWTEIGNVLTFDAQSPGDAIFTLAHGTDYFTSVRAKDAAGNTSTSATTAAWQLNYDYAKFSSTTVSGGGTSVNTAASSELAWTQVEMDTEHFNFDGGTPEDIEILTAGDYLVQLILPTNSALQRPNVRVEVFLDGTAVQGLRGESSYIRNGNSHTEGSNHVHALIPGVTANQIVTVEVRATALAGTVNISDQVTIVLTKVDASAKVINATATTTDGGGTNFHPAAATTIEWNRGGSDRYDTSTYTHTNGDDEITFDAPGDYLVYFNVPFFDPNGNQGTRTSPRGEVKINGGTVGFARQGYMRRASGNNESSIHWAGIIRGVNATDVLTTTVVRDTTINQAVNIGTGQSASLYIQQIETMELIDLSATTINNGAAAQTNWNQSGEVEWTTSNSIDTNIFTHDTGTDPQDITVDVDGDYYVVYNDNQTSTVQRANVKIELQVNGASVPGMVCKSHYIRSIDSHNESSCSFAGLLEDLSAGDIISFATSAEANGGTVNDATPANVLIWKRP